ncbi:MAG: hypothetical protein IH845_04610 [Nanoarchaeota archaeon]|nr:hypothetical protein [Nanoarchaeota archaeon]
MVKKSYNPFKMWGGYIGGIIIFLLLFLGPLYNWFVNNFIISTGYLSFEGVIDDWLCTFLFQRCFDEFSGWAPALFYYFLLPISFLIGWGINCLVRKLKERKQKRDEK